MPSHRGQKMIPRRIQQNPLLREAYYIARFYSHFRNADGCWEWTGPVNRYGYGLHWNGSKYVMASRMAYELAVHPIPDVLVIDHLCLNPLCVRPDHLEAVTDRENLLRGPTTMAAQNLAKTHCCRGHNFTAANTYRRPDGGRQCRACATADRRRYYAQRPKEARCLPTT